MPDGNSFDSRTTLSVGGKAYTIFKLAKVEAVHPEAKKLPFSLKVLHRKSPPQRGVSLAVRKADIEALARWKPKDEPNVEIAFTPARVLMQDFTGVPCVVDLAAMRDAMKVLGGDPAKINPLVPVELVIDHSVQVDEYGSSRAFTEQRSSSSSTATRSGYAFLRWGQRRSATSDVVPPGTGICHQVNLEFLAAACSTTKDGTSPTRTPSSAPTATPRWSTAWACVGWGVGGIEAEAAMLGQPVSMLIPAGRRVQAERQARRRRNRHRPGADRHADAPQEGRGREVRGVLRPRVWRPCRWPTGRLSRTWRSSTARRCGFFPVDVETLRYLDRHRPLAGAGCWWRRTTRNRGLFHDATTPEASYTDTLELDLLHRGAEPRRPDPPAGPRAADEHEAGVRGSVLPSSSPG